MMDQEAVKLIPGTWLYVLHAIQYVLLILLGLIVVRQRAYFQKKGENLATKEDIREITSIQEDRFPSRSEEWISINQNALVLEPE